SSSQLKDRTLRTFRRTGIFERREHPVFAQLTQRVVNRACSDTGPFVGPPGTKFLGDEITMCLAVTADHSKDHQAVCRHWGHISCSNRFEAAPPGQLHGGDAGPTVQRSSAARSI